LQVDNEHFNVTAVAEDLQQTDSEATVSDLCRRKERSLLAVKITPHIYKGKRATLVQLTVKPQ
jgi:hypothetical protein